ncbi:MAG: 3-hydroxyacyl-CoA dehydrogenase NAD-binding domain-containing protein [Pseudomonadota bacterium]
MVGRLEKRGDVGVLWINNPPVNAINRAVKRAIVDGLADAEADADIHAVVIACEGRTFIAGADIKEFGQVDAGAPATDTPDAMAALQRFPKPIVSAIHGTALGGGFEITLAGDYRVATPTARVGLPEVKIGLLPGWGGTQRLPRLIGAAAALELILSGDQVPAAAALEMGLIDRIADTDTNTDLVDAAVTLAREKAPLGLRRLDRRAVDPATAADAVFAAARERIARTRRGQHAPERIVDCVEAAARLPIDQGLAVEADCFMRCMRHPQSRALQHVFFAERQAASIPDLPAQVRPRPVRAGGVVGAGTMGVGIAMNLAGAGIPVTLVDSDAAALDRGLAAIRGNYAASVKRGRLGTEQAAQRLALIRTSQSYADLADADLIVEAVFELMSVKKAVFAELDQVVRPDAILATNTSFLSVDEIASATSRAGQVVGMHFFAPANVMRLVEVVRGATATSPETLAAAMDLARRMGKVGVVAGNCDGFIGNRMLNAYLHQADLLILEGATPQQVDRALVDFGMAMGPFQMMDLSNFDGLPRMRRDRGIERYDPRSVPVCERLVALGRYGQKTLAGYHDYSPQDRTPQPSPVAQQVIDDVAREFGIARRQFTDEDIVQRCLLALANVGFDILAEGMAYRAGDIDVVYLNGYGFPSHRGGPMYWIENDVGLAQALERVTALGDWTGAAWLKPSPLLRRLVAEGRGLSGLSEWSRPPVPAPAAAA